MTSLPSVSKEDELAGVSPLAPLQLYRSKDRRGAVDRFVAFVVPASAPDNEVTSNCGVATGSRMANRVAP